MNNTLKLTLSLTVSILVLLAASAPALAGGNLNAFLGSKTMDESDWTPVDEHGALALEVDMGIGESPMSFALNLLNSFDRLDETFYHYSAKTLELQVGLKYFARQDKVRPFIGGGLSYVYGYYEVESQSIMFNSQYDSDNGTGAWVSTGIIVVFRKLNVGAELGYSTADIELFGTEVDAGGTRLGILVGMNW